MPRTSKSPPLAGSEDVIVVLGCRVVAGIPSDPLRRRLEHAAQLHATRPDLPIVMSGGKKWGATTESAVMCRWWSEEGPGTGSLLEESSSQTTRENALRVAELCRRLDYRHVLLVTCDFHMKRAHWLFARQMLNVTRAPAIFERSTFERWKLTAREWGAALLGEVDSWLR